MSEKPSFDSVGESNPSKTSVAEQTRSTNEEGGVSFDPHSPELGLYKVVITNLLDDTFYDSVEESFDKVWDAFERCADENPEFVLQLAAYARQEEGFRDIAQLLLVLAANHRPSEDGVDVGPEWAAHYVPEYAPAIIDRTDEFNTVVSYQLRGFGKPIPRPLRQGIEDALHKKYSVVKYETDDGYETNRETWIEAEDDEPFDGPKTTLEEDGREVVDVGYVHDEYTFTKYSQRDKEVSLHDVINLVRPNPRSEDRDELFGRVVKGELDDHPDVEPLREDRTWESELSEDDDRTDAEKFRERLDDMGLMARVRNLRNMLEAGLTGEEIFDYDQSFEDGVGDGGFTGSTPEVFGPESKRTVRNSKMFPFRFYQAYKACTDTEPTLGHNTDNYFHVSGNGVLDDVSKEWLESAIDASVENLPDTIENTYVAIDTSGSMFSPVSGNSELDCVEIGALFGAVLMKRGCEAGVFATDFKHVVANDNALDDLSVFELAEEILEAGSGVGGGTDGGQVVADLRERDWGDYDRVVYLTDLQLWGGTGGLGYGSSSLTTEWDNYRDAVETDPTLYTIDLASYGDLKMPESRTDVIQVSGWSESVIEFIDKYENGDEVIDEIAEVTPNTY